MPSWSFLDRPLIAWSPELPSSRTAEEPGFHGVADETVFCLGPVHSDSWYSLNRSFLS